MTRGLADNRAGPATLGSPRDTVKGLNRMAPEHGRMNASPECAPFTPARAAARRRTPRAQHTLGTLAMIAMLCVSALLSAVRAHADSAAEGASSETPGKAVAAIADSAVSPAASGAGAPACRRRRHGAGRHTGCRAGCS